MTIEGRIAARRRSGRIGILGGMGPAAGVDLAQKIIAAAAGMGTVRVDQDQVPFVLWSIPQVPDRGRHLFDHSAPDPYPMLMDGIRGLQKAGATVIAIGCNTAHYWHNRLAAQSRVPILHIVESTIEKMAEAEHRPHKVGVLGTVATLKLGIYQERLERDGFDPVVPTESEMQDFVMAAVNAVKRSKI